MKNKIIQFKSYSQFFLLILLFTQVFYAQNAIVIDSVSPTRVTTGSVITVYGTGFTSDIQTDNSIIKVNDMAIDKRTFDSDNPGKITFEVTRTAVKTVDISNPNPVGGAGNDISRFIKIDNVDTTFELKYIAPTKRVHKVNVNNQFSVTKIDEIYTDFQYGTGPSFWRSNQGPTPDGNPNIVRPFEPDNNHNLLGFKYEGTIYSTGVADAKLLNNLQPEIDADSNLNFQAQIFKAYSTNGVTAKTVRQHHIFTGDDLDGRNLGESTTFFTTKPLIQQLNMYEVLIDGVQGLNLGTGVNNLNADTTIRFLSGNGQAGTVAGDDIPDLIITNMAEAGKTDVYAYVDVKGNVIGRPISVTIDNSDANNPGLSEWDNDQYRVQIGENFDVATITSRIYNKNQRRPMRMLAFKLSEFGINDQPMAVDPIWSIESIEDVTVGAGGSADHAFLAYNGGTFEIKSPKATKRPLSRSICRVPAADVTNSGITITFEAEAQIDGVPTPTDPADPDYNEQDVIDEALDFQWYKFGLPLNEAVYGPSVLTPSLTLTDINETDLGVYKLYVTNAFGRTIIEANLSEGGTPAIWSGSNSGWQFPPGFVAVEAYDPVNNPNDIVVLDEDRLLIFSVSYTETGGNAIVMPDITEGCDCIVAAGRLVRIPSGKTLKLYGAINVEEGYTFEDADEDGNLINVMVPAGRMEFQNNASLLQTKAVTENTNSGNIKQERIATNLHENDYVYWSSPVVDFNITGITGTTNPTLSYRFDPLVTNANNTRGNWETAANSIMESALGYIVKVPNANDFTTIFEGKPFNGEIKRKIKRVNGGGSDPSDPTERYFNLLGNPYPSALNADKLLEFNAAPNPEHPNGDGEVIEGFIEVWTHNTALGEGVDDPYYDDFAGDNYDEEANYLRYNLTGANPPADFDGNIASGQGFMVQARRQNKDVVFNNAMRFDETENAYDNDDFFRSGAQNTTVRTATDNPEYTNEKVWLSLVNENTIASSTLIGYVNGATLDRDVLFDSHRSTEGFSVYSLIDQEAMMIQGRSLPFTDSDIVPIGVTLDSDGIYNLAINQVEGNLFADGNQAIYIEDIYLNTIHDLRDSPYTFAGTTGVISDRFLLRYTNDAALSINEIASSNTFAFVSSGVLNVNSNQRINGITIYDISGKIIIQYQANASDRFSADFNFSRGAYLASITLDNGAVVTKKLMN